MKRLVFVLCLSIGLGGALPGSIAQDVEDNPSPSIFGDVGRWLEWSFKSIGTQFKSEGNRPKAPDTDTKVSPDGVNAAPQVARIPIVRMVSGHQICPISENGAPNCNAAAERLCKANGLNSGASLEITAAQDCPVRAVLQKEARSECRDVTFVTRALCQ